MGESLSVILVYHPFWCAVFQYPGVGASYVPCPLPRSRSSIMSWVQDVLRSLSLSEMQFFFFLGLCPNVLNLLFSPSVEDFK